MKLTQKILKHYLYYNPRTGEWFRIRVPRSSAVFQEKCQTQRLDGYCTVQLFYKVYKLHRLAWLYMTGRWPKRIDHRDGNPANNKWSNLREATNSQNIANSKLRKDNKLGFKGAYPHRKGWVSCIRHNKKLIYLGFYKTPIQAHRVYAAKAKELHGEFARVR